MPITPLTQDQAEEIVTRWLADHLPTDDASPSPSDIAGWLTWHETDLAFVTDVDVPTDVVTDLGATTVRMPRIDVPSDGANPTVEAPVELDELRLVVDRATGEVAGSDAAVPISQTLESLFRAKDLPVDTAGPPADDEGADEQP